MFSGFFQNAAFFWKLLEKAFSENRFPGGKGKMARKRAEWGKGKTKSNAGKREKAEPQIRNRSPGREDYDSEADRYASYNMDPFDPPEDDYDREGDRSVLRFF